jgi:hypothetical protein
MRAEDRRADWSWRERLRREQQERKDPAKIISNRHDEFRQRDEHDARLRKKGIDPIARDRG